MINHSKGIKGLKSSKVSKSGDTMTGSLDVPRIDADYLHSSTIETNGITTYASDYLPAMRPYRASYGSIGTNEYPYLMMCSRLMYLGSSVAGGAPDNSLGILNLWNGASNFSSIYADPYNIGRSLDFLLPADDYEDGGYIATRNWVNWNIQFDKLTFDLSKYVGSGFVARVGRMVLIHFAGEVQGNAATTIGTVPGGFYPDTAFSAGVFIVQKSSAGAQNYGSSSIMVLPHGSIEIGGGAFVGYMEYTGVYQSRWME